MKRFLLLLSTLALTLVLPAQVTNLEFRLSGDMWKLGYHASSVQINCGLCPQLIQDNPEIETAMGALGDSITSVSYRNLGPTFSVGASIIWPALRAELQVAPSMRKADEETGRIAGRYANRNISALLGLNPMAFDRYAGKFYLGRTQQWFLDLSDGGVFAQFSYDSGFEEYVGSINNIAMLVRWQPTIWTSDKQRLGFSLRGGARAWLLGNSNYQGPFLTENGFPRKVKPSPDWFLGFAIKVVAF